MKPFALKGHIIFAPLPFRIFCLPNFYLVCENNKVVGAFDELPFQYEKIDVVDYTDQLIIPGMTDLHVHAPQYKNRGIGLNKELLHWLNDVTFPEEFKYSDSDYAQLAYKNFVHDLTYSTTTRAIIYSTIYKDSTLMLMQMLEASGLKTLVGKVNMDDNSPIYYEEVTDVSLKETKQWIESSFSLQRTKPIITPRFAISCSSKLLKGLSLLANAYDLPVQSHLSENKDEIAWVKQLFPECANYADVYYQHGLLKGGQTVMAHCVHCNEQEIELLQRQGTYIAHCPASNTHLASGIAPIKKYLKQGLLLGLGSDISAGVSLSGLAMISDAIAVSKLRYRLIGDEAPLTFNEAFFMATKGGGAFFGKVGSFENGYDFDALVFDDRPYVKDLNLDPVQRLERIMYLNPNMPIVSKYVDGQKVF